MSDSEIFVNESKLLCFVHPIFSYFGLWYFVHFSYVIFFRFFSVLTILPCKMYTKNTQYFCIFITFLPKVTKKPKTKNGMNKTIISWLGQNIPTFQISKIIWNMQVHMFQTLSTRWQKDTLTACVLFLAKNPTTYTLLAQLANEESGSGFDAKYYQRTLFCCKTGHAILRTIFFFRVIYVSIALIHILLIT